jgi:hypothetical protein
MALAHNKSNVSKGPQAQGHERDWIIPLKNLERAESFEPLKNLERAESFEKWIKAKSSLVTSLNKARSEE